MNQLKKLFYLCLLPCIVNAQVIVGDSLSPFLIYKNIKDTIISITPQGSKFCSIDLDGDNLSDIRFRISQSYSPGHTWENQSVRSLNGFEFVTLLTPVKYLDTLTKGSSINNNLNWYSTSDSVNLFNYASFGGSTTVTGIYMRHNNYLGFRKVNLTDTVYGWMLLDADLYSGLKIRSWAYQNTLKSGIYKMSANNRLWVYPNPASNLLHILDESYSFQNSNIEVTNYLGRTVLVQSYSKEVDVSGLSKGLYTLKIVSSGKVVMHAKFFKE